jgi:cation-transporting ATPase I
LLTELQARRRVWELREPEFYAKHGHRSILPTSDRVRCRAPKGPWRRGRSGSRSPRWPGSPPPWQRRGIRGAADAFLAGTPKAARLGREAFAAQLGRTLATRGVVPLDGSALRRLDRIDTVVLDSDVLVTGRAAVGPVVAFDEERVEELRAVAEGLLDPDDTTAERSEGHWSLRPFDAIAATGDGGAPGVTLPRGAKVRADEQRRAGARPLGLVEDIVLVAVVGAVAELEPGAEVVVEAVRRSGHRFVIAGDKGNVCSRFDPDLCVPRGKPLGAAIRALQAEDAAVLAIGRRGKMGLSAADVAAGITRATGRPPWGADLVFGHELAESAILIDATTVAAEVSGRSGRFALGGSGPWCPGCTHRTAGQRGRPGADHGQRRRRRIADLGYVGGGPARAASPPGRGGSNAMALLWTQPKRSARSTPVRMA